MNIVMLSVRDACASGLRLCEAINENTKHTIKLYQFRANPFDHPRGEFVTKDNVNQVQKEINRADIIHVKGDHAWSGCYPGLKHYPCVRINQKPIILTLTGDFTRAKKFGGLGNRRCMYPDVKIVTTHEAGLNHDWVDFMTFYAIRQTETTWKQSDPPILQHIPSSRRTKKTEFVLKIVDKLKKNVTFELLENIQFAECLEAKKRATLYLDQFLCGWYGNSGAESMNYGVPVVNWISDFCKQFVDTPVITTNGNASEWAGMIDSILDSDMSELSRQTKEYCNKYHSYESVARQWDRIYRQI